MNADKRTRIQKIYGAGSDAYHIGASIEDNPYLDSYSTDSNSCYVIWRNGFLDTEALHQGEKK